LIDPKSASDEQLMAALGQRSSTALEELFDRHHRVALAVAYRIVGQSSLAEDVVQDAFAAAWGQAGSFDERRGGARSWLLSIVRHRAIDATRKSSFRQERVPLDDVVERPSPVEVWSEVEKEIDGQLVRRALSAIPAEQRQAIELAYFGGLTNQEIAGSLQVPLGTVKGRIRLGMQKLRTLLVNGEEGGTD
jgi:RNA polymerase sigma-70 factor (ECF subfamily)